STIRVERPKDWSALESAFAEGRPIAGTVTEVVKGGLRVDVGVEAFLPASRSGARELADMEKLVGQEIQCKIIKLDTANDDVVVDRRALLEEEAAKVKEQAFSALKEGMVVRGAVRSLTDFGAFVELSPGVDGLLHVADMAWHRIGKPSAVVSIGDSVEVKILKIVPETHKISLGMKQLAPDPWTLAGERFHVGDRVQGKISRLQDFGAFVELAPGVDGLIHVSELSWSKKIRKPADVVKVGEMVEAVVLGVNTADKRISLGLKQALGDPWEEALKKYPVGATAEGAVTNLQQFGAFVDLGSGVEGMIHVSDISREKRLNHPREALTMGQVVKAAVIEVDKERRRIKLSMKQLEPTTIDHFIGEHKTGEVVTGRVVDTGKETAKIELGDGVFAMCPLPRVEVASPAVEPVRDKTDLSSMTAMLASKWKKGGDAPSTAAGREGVRPGEIRSFRIVEMDAAKKRVLVELAG
ncbi:MAG TPA: S1 RNA-binding domain-containing protein, partial [Bryobacteraceae bacterium]|nr:S1 RNA-binding domain-containing protein [Bryobacteraceae bacterium]